MQRFMVLLTSITIFIFVIDSKIQKKQNINAVAGERISGTVFNLIFPDVNFPQHSV